MLNKDYYYYGPTYGYLQVSQFYLDRQMSVKTRFNLISSIFTEKWQKSSKSQCGNFMIFLSLVKLILGILELQDLSFQHFYRARILIFMTFCTFLRQITKFKAPKIAKKAFLGLLRFSKIDFT